MTENKGQEASKELAEQADATEEPGSRDEVPGDIRAFYGHPLANGEDTNASALALLHEYQNLPAIDRSDQKVGDKFDGLSEILRQEEENKKSTSSDYSMLLTSDVDAFLNRNGKADGSKIRALDGSLKIDGRKSSTPNLSSPSPLLASGPVRLTDHDSPSPSKCLSGYGHYSPADQNSDTSGSDDVHTSLTAPLKIVEDISMAESSDAVSPKDSVSDNQDRVDGQSESPQDAEDTDCSRSGTNMNINKELPEKDRNETKQIHMDVPSKSKKKQKAAKSGKPETMSRSILAEALTSGSYKPTGGLNSPKPANGRLLTSKPDIIPPPPPYQTPPHSVTLQPALSLPPVSAICQQIQRDHPQMAEVPLANFKKSLCALGFPESKEEGAGGDKSTTSKTDTASKGIVHSLLLNSKGYRPDFKDPEQVSSRMTSHIQHNSTFDKQTVHESTPTEDVRRDYAEKRPKKRKKQLKAQSESLNVSSSQKIPKIAVSSGAIHIENKLTSDVSCYQTVPQPLTPNSVVKPLDSLQKLSSNVPTVSSVCHSATFVRKTSVDSVRRNSFDVETKVSSSSVASENTVKPTIAYNTPDAESHMSASYPVKKLKTAKQYDHMLSSNNFLHSYSKAGGRTESNYPPGLDNNSKFTNLSNTAGLSSRNEKPDYLKRSSSCVERLQESSREVIQSNSLNKSVEPQSTSMCHFAVQSEPKTSLPQSPAVVPNSNNQSPVQYLPVPYSSVPPDESQLVFHLLGGTVLRPHGTGPASHVIVPKSVFHMATQRLSLPFSGVDTLQNHQISPNLSTAVNAIPASQEAAKQEVLQAKDTDENRRHGEPLTEKVIHHYLHSKSVDEGTKEHLNYKHYSDANGVHHSTAYKSDTERHYIMHSKSLEAVGANHTRPFKSSQVSSVAENLSLMGNVQGIHRHLSVPESTEQHVHSESNGYSSDQRIPESWEPYSRPPSFLPVTTSSECVSRPSQIYSSTATLHSPDTVITQYSDVSDTSSGRQSASIFEDGTQQNNTDGIGRSVTNQLTCSSSVSAPTTPVYYTGQKHPFLPADHKEISTKSALDQLNAYASQMAAISTQYSNTPNLRLDVVNKIAPPSAVTSAGTDQTSLTQQNTSEPTTQKSVASSSEPYELQNGYEHRYHSEGLVPLKSFVSKASNHVSVPSSSGAHSVPLSVSNDNHATSSAALVESDYVTSKKLTKAWIDKAHKDQEAGFAGYSESLIHQMKYGPPSHTRHVDSDSFRIPKQQVVTPSQVRHNWHEHQYILQNDPPKLPQVKEEDQPLYCDKKHLYSYPYDLSMSKPEVLSPHKSKPLESNNNQLGSSVQVIKPQTGPVTPPNAMHAGYPHDLKSPDSGYNETCVSPSEGNSGNPSHPEYVPERRSTQPTSDVTSCDRPQQQMKRRRSVSMGRHHQSLTGPEKNITHVFCIPKLDQSQCHYRCYLETPISASQKVNEDKMTYLNKGQYYNLVIEYKRRSRPLPSKTVKSRVMVVFREDKCVQDEYKAWEFWHSKQHSPKQRALELDGKNCSGVIPGGIEEVSHNCISFKWNPLDQAAKVSVSINCLSTDFSNQKGVKGLPLHVEVDTYETEQDPTPVHRSYCQIKVFCDKGAERKARDEERKKEAKHKDMTKSSKKKMDTQTHPPCDISEFYHRADIMRQTVLYSPATDTEDVPGKVKYLTQPPKSMLSPLYITSGDEPDVVPCKRSRKLSKDSTSQQEKVLLYVREKSDPAFTALMLLTPTMDGLAKAIEEKYSLPAARIRNVYKRSQKGILVKMDDNIIRHYSNEATFLISIQNSETDGASYDITLSEVDIN